VSPHCLDVCVALGLVRVCPTGTTTTILVSLLRVLLGGVDVTAHILMGLAMATTYLVKECMAYLDQVGGFMTRLRLGN
jgi:hypothetical protein